MKIFNVFCASFSKIIKVGLFLFMMASMGYGQELNFREVPKNAYLAESAWPLFHRNPYAQASGNLDVLDDSDSVRFKRFDNPEGGTAPWTVVGEKYDDGSQAVFSNTQKGVIKWLENDHDLKMISYLPLDRGRFDFDWNVAALATGELIVTSIKDNIFYLLKDSKEDCPSCELVISRIFEIPKSYGDLTIHFTISYDGHILALMEPQKLAAISLKTGKVVDVTSLHENGKGGYSYHNAFATDEAGRIYITSQTNVIAFDWTGNEFVPAWKSNYDFRGPGCKEPKRKSRFIERIRTIRGKRCTGTGTTPTLMGDCKSGLVVMVDGHAPQNNLVAFWRDSIPEDWKGLPGEDRRLAGRLPLPNSTPEGEGHTAENSPAVAENMVFIAQWAGFNPDCTPPMGVQRVDWNSTTRKFELVWANGQVHFNGIPTVSTKTNLVYGTGRGEGCTYAYRGLDITTGALKLDLPLGDDKKFTDQGNQQAITDNGSIVVAVRKGTLFVTKAPK